MWNIKEVRRKMTRLELMLDKQQPCTFKEQDLRKPIVKRIGNIKEFMQGHTVLVHKRSIFSLDREILENYGSALHILASATPTRH